MNHEFITWCDERTASCMSSRAALHAEGRGDEANFMQIRANVYGIFRSVFIAMKGDLSRVAQQLTSIPAAWEKSLQQAETHGETDKAHIERIKLETAASIRHYIANLEAKQHD